MNEEVFSRIKKIAERLKKEYSAEKVILYGSYAKGEAAEDSDVDLFIIAPTNERFFQRMATVLRLIRDLKKGIPIEPIVLTSNEVKERIEIGDQFVKQIIEEGIIL
ncbi:MAG TPA: nucleotidyltransferase domain-containing protein [Syntrophaceae bacterium]|nr:nucleotidyltransferase domain-containing protein [Syntrophaceae bacterium]